MAFNVAKPRAGFRVERGFFGTASRQGIRDPLLALRKRLENLVVVDR